ncbi:hypothetical protein [Microcoleus sp. S13_C5]|uniref:hypothetical protein n=1 Tax=Microcoleus sp. S13_C5 TaxID=3055411 RepID=UPI002FD00DDF
MEGEQVWEPEATEVGPGKQIRWLALLAGAIFIFLTHSQQSTVNSQQSTVNSQQSTVNSQQSTIMGYLFVAATSR